MIIEKAETAPNDTRNRIFMAGTASQLGIKNIDPKTHILTRATILFYKKGVKEMLVSIDKVGNQCDVFTSMPFIPELV